MYQNDSQLNAIAPLLSNFFLAAYALINFSVFHASISRSPGWRPAFRYYNAWISLIGTLLCIAVMFLMSWWTALITLVVVVTLYLYVSYRKPEVNWGSSTQAQSFNTALKAVQDLNLVEEHVKNYRPQILVFTGLPSSRPPLVDFANLITKKLSLLICGHIIKGSYSQAVHNAITRKTYRWLFRHKVKAFYTIAEGGEDGKLETGARSLMTIAGLGKLRPNMLLMGFKSDWRTSDREDVLQYFNIIHYALDRYLAVGILRVQEGLDYSNVIEDEEVIPLQSLENKDAEEKLRRNQSAGQLSQGLTLLIPYILTTRSQFAGSKLRIFSLANKKNELERDQRNMAALLSKFRIDYSDVIVIPDVTKKAKEETKKEFESLIEPFRIKCGDAGDHKDDLYIKDSELLALKEKTNRHMRLRELLLEHSTDANFVVILTQDGTSSEASSPPSSPKVERGGHICADPSGDNHKAEATHGVTFLKKKKIRKTSSANIYFGPGGTPLSKEVLNNITIFQRRQRKGTIDVWWLYDDGGLYQCPEKVPFQPLFIWLGWRHSLVGCHLFSFLEAIRLQFSLSTPKLD
ncbi:hypothetical protein J437_LFUL012199 [Ladona fulva]|uniref:Uncharacterized protein n=1 Tax=Ladona fulva TaxID=123851 RepID=A0A8K0KNX0_LADFU|nr:hypothetical protein J437_LFUL012199 [Ladona fulva]